MKLISNSKWLRLCLCPFILPRTTQNKTPFQRQRKQNLIEIIRKSKISKYVKSKQDYGVILTMSNISCKVVPKQKPTWENKM